MNTKMNAFKFLFTPLIMALAFSCDYNEDENIGPTTGQSVTASGNLVSETRTVDSFHSISANIVGRIFLTQGSLQELRIETPQNILDVLKTEVNNGVLGMEF